MAKLISFAGKQVLKHAFRRSAVWQPPACSLSRCVGVRGSLCASACVCVCVPVLTQQLKPFKIKHGTLAGGCRRQDTTQDMAELRKCINSALQRAGAKMRWCVYVWATNYHVFSCGMAFGIATNRCCSHKLYWAEAITTVTFQSHLPREDSEVINLIDFYQKSYFLI